MHTSVETFGRCFAPVDTVRSLAQRGDWAALGNLPGNYTLAIRSGTTVTLVGSAIGPSNLFYSKTAAGFFYATNLIELLKQSGGAWRWNWSALADMTTLEHCVDGHTLHADVHKVGPGVVVHFDGSSCSSQQVPWVKRVVHENASPQGAVDALVESCQRHVDTDVVVSMSAGFDSRLLLACLLASGVKPRLISMGTPDSTDVRVSAAIAREFSLQFDRVPLDASNYLELGNDITKVTGGTKSFQNWHTYAYAKSAPLTQDSRVFIGSNGEAARTYYLDKGIASLAAQLASGPAKNAFWARKTASIFAADELPLFNPGFAAQLSGAGLLQRRRRLQELSSGSLLDGLDRFYTEQRVSNFIANGLSLVDVHARTAAPMLDQTWMSHIWNLRRSWKLDSKWHRHAIAKLCPRLLSFEEEATGEPMHGTSRTLYWLPRKRRHQPAVPYMNYDSVLRSDAVSSFVNDARHRIEPIAKPELVSLVFERHRRGERRTRAASFLVTMLFLCGCLQDERIRTLSN